MPFDKQAYDTALKGEKGFTNHQLQLIRFWHSSPKAKITAKQIAKEFRYEDGNRANIDIGNIAKVILHNLEQNEDRYRDGADSWLWDSICDTYSKGWVMAEAFMEALEETGIVSRSDRYYERPPMRQDLPPLDKKLLNLIYNSAFSLFFDLEPEEISDEKTLALIKLLLDMKAYNYKYRLNDRIRLFPELDKIFRFDYNTEGTALFLSLILAIQELYGLSDGKLLKHMREMVNDD